MTDKIKEWGITKPVRPRTVVDGPKGSARKALSKLSGEELHKVVFGEPGITPGCPFPRGDKPRCG